MEKNKKVEDLPMPSNFSPVFYLESQTLMLFLLSDFNADGIIMLSEAKHLASIANEARFFAKTLRMTAQDREIL